MNVCRYELFVVCLLVLSMISFSGSQPQWDDGMRRQEQRFPL